MNRHENWTLAPGVDVRPWGERPVFAGKEKGSPETGEPFFSLCD